MIQKRELWVTILLNLVTCGIYSLFFVYDLARDSNKMCEGDKEETPGLAVYILLSIVTCGIYQLYWEYKLGNRLQSNAPRYGLNFIENGTTILMWTLLGSVLCGVGYFIALHIIIKNTNEMAEAYNRRFAGNGFAGSSYASASATPPFESAAPQPAVQTKTVYCSECGAKNVSNNSFCSSCGARLLK